MNNNRNENQRPQRPPMTPEQKHAYEERKRAYIERKRAEREAENKRRELVRRRLILAIIFIVTLAVVIGTAAVIISIALRKGSSKTPEVYTFKIGSTKEKVAYADANRGGIICINVRSLKDILSLTESSSRTDAVTFTARGSGSGVVFTDGSTVAAVNGQNVQMPAAATVSEGVCSVPLETVAYIFGGINIAVKNSTVTISRNDENIEIYAKSHDTLNMIIEFKSKLDKYEEYMNPQGEKRDDFLLLVNKKNPLGKDYTPQDLFTLSSEYCINTNANQLNKYAAEALCAMLTELWAQTGDTSIIATSGYRSFERQQQLFTGRYPDVISASHAEELKLNTAFPGYSEHQSGLCIDLVDTERGDVVNYADTGCFTSVATYNWLKNNAWKFGFVLRYPSDKENITGYEYESWHYRFVGRYHAEKIYRSGVTLDEYIASLG